MCEAISNISTISFKESLENDEMKKDSKSSPNLKDLFGIKDPSDRGKNPFFKKTHFTIWYFLIAFLVILLIQNYFVTKKVEDVIPYSEFKETVKREGQGSDHHGRNHLGTEGDGEGPPEFQTVRVVDPDLVKDLDAHHIKYTGKIDSKWLTNILSWIFPSSFSSSSGGSSFRESGRRQA